jgi:hypothetical protein
LHRQGDSDVEIALSGCLGYGKEPRMTQSSKHGRSLKMARAISRRKYKAAQKRKNAEKYAARTGGRQVP